DRAGRRVDDRARSLPRPVLPFACAGVARLERQPPTGAQGSAECVERAAPLVVAHEELRHVTRHDREVGAGHTDVVCAALDPAHVIAVSTATRDVEHEPIGIDADDAVARSGEARVMSPVPHPRSTMRRASTSRASCAYNSGCVLRGY